MKQLLLKLKSIFNKEVVCAGLDIGTADIKLVKLNFTKDGVSLSRFATCPAPGDIAGFLRKELGSGRINKLNISVGGTSVITRYVAFPMMTSSELKQALRFEASKHIPFSAEEAVLDSFILKEELPGNKMLVLLAAVKKDFLAERLKILEGVGLKVDSVDVDSLALVNAFEFNYLQEPGELRAKAIALLNIGALASNLSILESGTARLSRDIRIAGNNFDEKIAQNLGLDNKAAGILKLNPDKDKIEKITASFEAVLGNLALELKTSFDYYESQGASSIAKIFLSGGQSRFIGLGDMLASLLGIEVEYWSPFNRINVSPGVDAAGLKSVEAALAVAVGLSLRK